MKSEKKYQTVFSRLLAAILFGFILHINLLAQQGGLDTTFGTSNTGIYQDPLPTGGNPAFASRAYGINEILPDGKIIVAGSATGYTSNNTPFSDFVVRRLNANGTLDTTFGNGGDVQTTFYRWGSGVGEQSDVGIGAMKVQPDGKIIVAGICRISNTIVPNGTGLGNDLCLVRYNANGSLDTGFGGNTVFSYGGNQNFPGNNNTVDAGKVFTVTGTNTVNNATNGFNGIPVKIRLAPDGRIYVFGYNSSDTFPGNSRTKSFVAVYSTNGTLQTLTSLFDTTGNTTNGYGVTRIYDGDLLSDGSFIAVGQQTRLVTASPQVFSNYKWVVFRANNTPIYLDQVNSNPNEGGFAITQLRSNKILIGGGTNGTPTLVRYNGDLTIDTTFGTNGKIVYDGNNGYTGIDTFYIGSLQTQPDGKIIATTNNGNIVRLNTNGSLDRSFARLREDVADSLSLRGILSNYRYVTPFPVPSGNDQRISFGGVSFRPNGKLVTSGNTGGGSRAVVTQLKTSFRNGGTFSDFNNDGKSEIAVFRDGFWYQLDSFSGNFSGAQFGAATDKPVPADFDGDGKTDLAVYRPSNGYWYILQSSNNQFRAVLFGVSEDLPRPGDFNGDGQADIAVFRPSNGTWYILYSNPIQPGNITFAGVAFGQSGDIPLLADFDGDGKSDIAVYRNGNWYYLQSSDNQFHAVPFGAAGDITTAGDYDGDGKTDIAVFRPSTGYWYQLNSSNGAFVATLFGQNGDKPVPGDFDNDGRTDIAVFRSGVWYGLRSNDNSLFGVAFGAAADVPIQAVYQQ